MDALFSRARVLVRGGGDLASGVVYRLYQAGFPVVVTELATPLFVRRTVCYGEAVYSGQVTVEGVTARCVDNDRDMASCWLDGVVPVVVDAECALMTRLQPLVVVDARMAKVNLGTQMRDAPLVVTLGPGFTAGVDCHAVIETNRGHALGRVIWQGAAEADTGEPGLVMGKGHSRVLRAPAEGQIRFWVAIGDYVEAGQALAVVSDATLFAPFAGRLRGMVHERVPVHMGMKVGDLDPRAVREHCFTISDKSLAIGGGVVEAVLSAPQVRASLRRS